MHQLPITMRQVMAEVGPDAKLTTRVFRKVAEASQQSPPVTDFNKFAVHCMAKISDSRPHPKMQVLQLYGRLMAWLENARPDVNVNSGYWAAAALQHAMMHYLVVFSQSSLATVFGVKLDPLKERVEDIKQLLTAPAGPLQSISYTERLESILAMPRASATTQQRMQMVSDDGEEEDRCADAVLEAQETLTSQGSGVSSQAATSTEAQDAAAPSPQQQPQQQKSQADLPVPGVAAEASQQRLPAVEYTKVAVHSVLSIQDLHPSIKMQVLQLYVRLMVWLADTNPDFSVNENQWAAAALQHATMHHRVQVHSLSVPELFAVKPAVLQQRVDDIKRVLTADASGVPCSYFERLQSISTEQCDAVQHLLELMSCQAPDIFPETAYITLPEGNTAARSQQKLALDTHAQHYTNKSGRLVHQQQQQAMQFGAHFGAHSRPPLLPQQSALDALRASQPQRQQPEVQLAAAAATPAQPSRSPTSASAQAQLPSLTRQPSQTETQAMAAASQEVRLQRLRSAGLGTRISSPTPHTVQDVPNMVTQVMQTNVPRFRHPGAQAQAPLLHPVLHRLSQTTSQHPHEPFITADWAAPEGSAQHGQVSAPKAQPAASQQSDRPSVSSAVSLMHKLRQAAPQPPSQAPTAESTPAQHCPAAVILPEHAAAQVQSITLLDIHRDCQEHAQQTAAGQIQQGTSPELLGPATQQLHKLLLQLESTAQKSAVLTHPVAACGGQAPLNTEAGGTEQRSPRDPRDRPLLMQILAPKQQQALPADRPADGTSEDQEVVSEPQEASVSPWCMLPGPLHAAIATAMARQDFPGTASGTPRTALFGARASKAAAASKAKGVKRPRAESTAKAESAIRSDTASRPAIAAANGSTGCRTIAVTHAATGNAVALDIPKLANPEDFSAMPDSVPQSVPSGVTADRANAGTAKPAQQADSSFPGDSASQGDSVLMHGFTAAAELSMTMDSTARGQSPVQPGLQTTSVSELTQDEPSVSHKLLCGQHQKHRDLQQHLGSGPAFEHPAGPIAKRQRSGAVLECETIGAVLRADSDAHEQTTPLRQSASADGNGSVGPLPSSQRQRVNEEAAQDALLLLHKNMGQPASQQQQGVDHLASPRLDNGAVSAEVALNVSDVVRPSAFTDVDGNHDVYEVHSIIDHKQIRAGRQMRTSYLVRWKGYGPEDDLWQSKTSLRHARQAIQDYEAGL